jgi:hypothetical protein
MPALPATEEMRRAAEAHRSSVEAEPAYMAASLQDALGLKLVAYMVKVGDPKTVARWASDDRKPRPENEDRLRTAFYVFQLLNELESSHTVRAWFAGLNPLLDDVSPATALRDGLLKETVAAAKAFVSDG